MVAFPVCLRAITREAAMGQPKPPCSHAIRFNPRPWRQRAPLFALCARVSTIVTPNETRRKLYDCSLFKTPPKIEPGVFFFLLLEELDIM